ncbi:macrophage mannose receptor 1 [Parasteatoda tepidariorum]|uniref:macrophage mannose receptor 1 n=1 Tax=Parasteatoda tepidariorum TaxID=114398 RepID=UPI0039BCF821
MRWQTILHFISFCSAVICCNPGWFPYGQKCYRGIQFDYDVRLARRYCQIFGGDLAVISDNASLQNMASILFENSNEISYWVHENSSLGETVSSTYCSYIYADEASSVKLGTDGNCDNGKQFVCEVAKTDSDYICPTSWSYYGNICYKTFKNLATYEQAVSYCSLQRAQLTVLDNIAKEHNAASVIIGQKGAYLVAAKQVKINGSESFKWTSGNDFEPSCAECLAHNFSLGGCLGFSSDEQHPTMFTWVALNCSASNYYMCEMQPVIRSTTQASTEPTTTLAPLQCPVGYNWKAHEESGFCYWETTYESERLNWYQARKFCQAYGGDLATYDNAQQEEHGIGSAKGHYRGLWFGLKRGKDDLLHWVDNSTSLYTNWYRGEPDFSSPTKFCVKHGDKNSQWELDYCGVKRWFICKAPPTRNPVIPNLENVSKKIPCNFSGPSVYRNQWYLYEDHCYLVREEAKYSWDTAQYFCQDNGGHLASIHSFEETDFILRLMSTAPNTDFWIGLSARGLDSSLTWSDGTPLQFLYWEDNFNTSITVSKCVNFDKLRGSWKTEHCNRFLGVVCKRGVNASYDFATPEPTPLMPGNCEKEWYRLGNKCYKPYGKKWSQRKSWDEAKIECEKEGASLASIHSADEQSFITDIMLDTGTTMWIGLENIDKGTVFKWSDDSPLDYSEWNANEPMMTDEDRGYSRDNSRLCVHLDYESFSMGKWSDIPCHRRLAYVCQKSTNPLLTEPSKDPFMCGNITGWSRVGTTCYGIFEDSQLSWVEAQAKCRTYEANLATFTSYADAIFLKKKIRRQDQFFWIGVRETKMNQYVPVIKRETTYANWFSGQPRRKSQINNCVSMDSQARWIVQDCTEKKSFVCALSTEQEEYKNRGTYESILENKMEEEIKPTVGAIIENDLVCPENATWVKLGNICYYFSTNYKFWLKAMFLCHQAGGSLASFHSLEEVKLVQNYLKQEGYNTLSSFSIGLGRGARGSYVWVDRSPVDFTYWEDDKPPSDLRSNNECVKFSLGTARWHPMNCDYEPAPYMCSFSKEAFKLQKTDLVINTTKLHLLDRKNEDLRKSDVGYSLSTGGIVGILISVMLILIVIIGVIYHLFYSSHRTVSPTLLEPDNL